MYKNRISHIVISQTRKDKGSKTKSTIEQIEGLES